MIISIMDKSAGFYSCLFFMISHYIHAKHTNQSFRLITTSWLYNYKNGWTDYFEPIDFKLEKDTQVIKQYRHNQIIHNYSMHEYKRAIGELYKYNSQIIKHIESRKLALNLTDIEYDAIYIRRGDKLCSESKYIPSNKYVELLLEKHPECTTILVQTDDYNSYLDIQQYIKDRQLNIRVITTCNENARGFIVYDKYREELKHAYENNSHNKEYLSSIKPILDTTKTIDAYNKEELREHTSDLIVGVELVLRSKYCILDYQSNVSRFIMIAHNNHMNVFDIRYPNDNMSMNWTTPPPYW